MFNRRLSQRLAGTGTVEDNVGHRFATQVLRGNFAHYPANGIDNIGLATAVGATTAVMLRKARSDQ